MASCASFWDGPPIPGRAWRKSQDPSPFWTESPEPSLALAWGPHHGPDSSGGSSGLLLDVPRAWDSQPVRSSMQSWFRHLLVSLCCQDTPALSSGVFPPRSSVRCLGRGRLSLARLPGVQSVPAGHQAAAELIQGHSLSSTESGRGVGGRGGICLGTTGGGIFMNKWIMLILHYFPLQFHYFSTTGSRSRVTAE